MADGGEGTAAALLAALGGEWRSASVSDPLGREVEARYALLPDGRAVVEAAEAIGLARLGSGERDPLGASSRGLGELIVSALDAGATGLVVGLGDSATVDGGAGLREVLSAVPDDTVVACDVANPLLDPTLEVHDSNGTVLAFNDDWKSDQQTEIEATGIPPADDAESAILATLAPGGYTAIESGKNGESGVGLVEVYNLH